MNYSELLNKGVVARFILLLTILILGFLQMRNAYANRLNEKACQMIDNKLAIENIDKAIELNKQNPLYYANLGLIYARMDSLISLESFYADKKINSEMLDNALKYYHIAESLKVNDPLFCLNITLLYALKGDSENAVHYIDKIAEYANDEWYYLFSAHIYKNIDKSKAKENHLQVLLCVMRTLTLEQMESVEAGKSASSYGCDAAMNVVAGVWGTAVGIVATPFAGAAVGFGMSMFGSWVCSHVE